MVKEVIPGMVNAGHLLQIKSAIFRLILSVKLR